MTKIKLFSHLFHRNKQNDNVISEQQRAQLAQIGLQFPEILSFRKMLDQILAGASIARFGDGEFALAMGKDIPFQKGNSMLAKRLNEILLQPSDDKLLICIPSFKLTPPLPDFQKYISWWEKYWLNNWTTLSKIFVNKWYGNALFSREYIFPEIPIIDIKKIWDNLDVVFVVPLNGRFVYDQRLFGNIKSKIEINVPPQNAFDEYERILNECLAQSKDKLFFISAGPTATVLAADLSAHGYHALDMGHFPNAYHKYLDEAPLPEYTPMVREDGKKRVK